MEINYGIAFFYGDKPQNEIPKLPEGFRLIQDPSSWTVAVAPDGTRYYVTPNSLIKMCTASKEDEQRTNGGLKEGMTFCDTNVEIKLL